jgi:NAD+ kinase
MKKSVSLAREVYDFLRENGEVFAENSLADKTGVKGFSLPAIDKRADIVVTVGGDGTILWAVGTTEKPIFAINSGGMGFLAEVESKYAIEGLQEVVEGRYNVEERAKLKTLLDDQRLPDAINEVTLQTDRIAKIMYMQIFVESELLETLGADGVIVATPTGSTSYALSVGGPIMDPVVRAMIIAPLAPFRLSARPWVVPLEKKVYIKVLPKSKETKLVIDGDYTVAVDTGNKIVITASEKKARFVRFGESFYQMVRLKLLR